MTLNPLNELKRRLDDDKTPLPKRLCLAKNIVHSHHFSTAPKERIVAEWLQNLMDANKLEANDLRNILNWLSTAEDLTSELKSQLIQIVAQYVQQNPAYTHCIFAFLENSKISSQLNVQIDDYLTIVTTLLKHLRKSSNLNNSDDLLNNIIKYYRESKKKLEFIIKLLNGEHLETVFSFLDLCRDTVLNLCQTVLFPVAKRSYFISFLQTLIRKDNLEELIAEKGDNIQSVIKIMNTFFEFPKNRTVNNTEFLNNFIDVFVSSFKKENQIVFAFYIMVANVFKMEQNFITPAMNLPCIIDENDSKMKRGLFLNMLGVLLENEVDINVRLTDTFGEKISKVEIKKNFISFIQAVMMGQLKLEGKPDKLTLQIIKTAIKLDPVLIEQKINDILPPIMATKKSESVMPYYIEMLNCLIETLFKLSRGVTFINDILPSVKNILEACNTEQFQLKSKGLQFEEILLKVEYLQGDRNHEDRILESEAADKKIIRCNDIFPHPCQNVYGKLTSELMFRQNRELLESLQKNLEVHCLMMLEEGFVSPSIINLTGVLTSILVVFLEHNKMADHTVPVNIAEDFWQLFKKFEDECLSKFGQCILKLSYDPSLMQSFLGLCEHFAYLKLLNIKYSNVKLDMYQGIKDKYSNNEDVDVTSEVNDLSVILPCLNAQQWNDIIKKNTDPFTDTVILNLQLTKTEVIELMTNTENRKQFNTKAMYATREYLLEECIKVPCVIENNYYFKTLLRNLDDAHTLALAKSLVKCFLAENAFNRIDLTYFTEIDPIVNNKNLQSALVLQTARNIAKCFENEDVLLIKALNKTDFNMAAYASEVDIMSYFTKISIKPEEIDTVKNCIKIFKVLSIPYLEETYQLVAIFLMLAIKHCTDVKKVKRTIDSILLNIYELSLQRPDLYQIFPAEEIFNFKDDGILFELLTLKKTSNKMLIIKSLLELAVKKVRADSEQVKGIVEKFLKKNKKKTKDIQSFNNPVFQMTCIILPLIVKQKKAITSSAFRSILADLQEKLHKSLLDSFKNIDFSHVNVTEDSMMLDNGNMATLNAMAAYSLTLSKYCETTDAEELQNLDCLWSGLDYFVSSAIKSIEDFGTEPQHIESAIQLLNVILRHAKKLETHPIFQEKDKIFLQIWLSIKTKLLRVDKLNGSILEEIGVTLRFVCELVSVECFDKHFVGDLANLVVLQKPFTIIHSYDKSEIKSRKVFKYMWSQCLKANIVGQKCVALAKFMHRNCKNLRNWIRQHYESESAARVKNLVSTEEVVELYVEDAICEVIRLDLDSLCEILLAAKKISLDYKFVDVIFELLHIIYCNIAISSQVKCKMSPLSYYKLYEGCVSVLNNLLVAREEVIEDRWPCYMQCYRALALSLCEQASTHTLANTEQDKLSELAHNIEKLTQSIAKRKKHVSRIAAYTVADLCMALEKNAPIKNVRQHVENSVALLIQASDNTYAMAFLKRALVGTTGQMTMTNLYTMYKRYHKYVGNA